MALVYLGVGSNIEPAANVPRALIALSELGLPVAASSPFYRTEAIGRPEQEPYANGVWKLSCTVGPHRLKRLLRAIERRLGRLRTADRYAARPIDLDILIYDDLVVDDGELRIPDPHILERPFLGAGLVSLDPEIRLPGDAVPLRRRLQAAAGGLEEYPEISRLVCGRLEEP